MTTETTEITPPPATPEPETQEPFTGVRMLPPAEWERLFPLFADSFPGKTIPMPPMACCAVEEVDGEIVAAMFFTMVFHMEPFCARKGRGKSAFPKLVARLEQELATEHGLIYYVTAPNNPVALAREESLGRKILTGFVPVMKEID